MKKFLALLMFAAAPAYAQSSQNVTANVLKPIAGSVVSINVVNSSVAGYVVLWNGVTPPASGTALPTTYCMPVAASQGFFQAFPAPLYLNQGVTLLFSTSCTQYTPTGTAPIILTGQVQ